MTFRPTLAAFAAFAAGLVVSGAGWAQATDRPWNVGVVQDFTHNSNVYNTSTNSAGDTVSTTTLRGGLNLRFGRQRAYANASALHQRYSDANARSHNGYTLGTGLDWSTVERLSGSFTLDANRRLTDFNVGGIVPVTLANIEQTKDFNARVRLGVVTLLAFEAGVGQRQVSFSAPEFASREYKQDNGSLGVTYRPSAILTLGTGLSVQRTRFLAAAPGQSAPDRSDRQDAYLSANWVPTGASTVNARVNFGKTEYERATAADFSGITGSLSWAWRPTGRLGLTTLLSRDTGQESGFLRLVEGAAVSATDFSQVSNALSLQASYALTGKIGLTAGLTYTRRTLVDGFTGVAGSDISKLASLGAIWAATRTMSLGCSAGYDSRSATGIGSDSFSNKRFGCFGQFMLD